MNGFTLLLSALLFIFDSFVFSFVVSLPNNEVELKIFLSLFLFSLFSFSGLILLPSSSFFVSLFSGQKPNLILLLCKGI